MGWDRREAERWPTHLKDPFQDQRFQRKLPQSCLLKELEGYLGDRVTHELGMIVPKGILCLSSQWDRCPRWSQTHLQFLLEKFMILDFHDSALNCDQRGRVFVCFVLFCSYNPRAPVCIPRDALFYSSFPSEPTKHQVTHWESIKKVPNLGGWEKNRRPVRPVTLRSDL